MKTIQLTIFLFFNSLILFGQIKNGGFEISKDSLNITPKDWSVRNVEGFNYYLDNNVKNQGEKSFVIKSLPSVGSQSFLPFSQIVNMDIPSLKRVRISAFIKTDSINGGAALWCQVWDINKKQIGFVNSNTQGKINGSNDWKKCSLDLTINSKCKYLLLGGYLQGKGTIWFDNLTVDDIISPNVQPSKKVKKFIENFSKVVKKNSIYSDSLNWNILNSELDYLSRGITNIEDVSFISTYFIEKLREVGDYHSFIRSKELSETTSKINTDGRLPYGKIIDNSIGYIYVPGFMSMSDTSILNFATKIQNLIRKIDNESDIQGWIIDLRENTGGNMYPMIAGLGPIIGDATLGYFTYSKGENIKWFYEKGECGEGKKLRVKVNNPYVLKNKKSKIAVLIGSRTGSSGEMTTISFIGKPYTMLFGQKSAGFITANSGFNLLNGSTLLLATSYTMDRNLKKYLKPIIPDILIEDDNKTLQTASDWIKIR